MKISVLKSVILVGLLLSSVQAFAADDTIIYTSEIVPGASCICAIGSDGKTTSYTNQGAEQIKSLAASEAGLNPTCGTIKTRKYVCVVSPGLSGFQAILAEIVRTVVFVTMLLGVLAIVGLGIAWAWAGGDDVKMKTTLKTWGINVLVGLVILFLFRYILTFLAPWIFQ